jgi:hypothetical protein
MPPKLRRPAAAALLSSGLLAGPALASDDLSTSLANALGRDSTVTVHLRSYYFDRLNPGDVTNAATALGGWLGYESGWIANAVRFGVVGYTSQKLWGPLDKDGTDLLAPGQQSYSVIGQSWLTLKLADQLLTGGRFEVHQPEISATDNRMTPITYSGGNLTGKLGNTHYYAAYLNATKPKNSENFINFVQAAGINSAESEPLYLVGLWAPGDQPWRWHLSSYYVPNVLSSNYADTSLLIPLENEYRLRLGAQGMLQYGVGQGLLTGPDFSTWSVGLRADLARGPAEVTMAYQQTSTGGNYQTPYSGWAGYTYMIVKSFDLAGQKAWLLSGRYDFAQQGLPGFAMNAAVVYGYDAINPANGSPQPNWTEYDLTLDYRFTDTRWPEWLRPFWIRGRAAYVDMGSAGDIQDYRIILNYEWKF